MGAVLSNARFLPCRSGLRLIRNPPSPATTCRAPTPAFPRSSRADPPSLSGSSDPPFNAYSAFSAHFFELRRCMTTSDDTVVKTALGDGLNPKTVPLTITFCFSQTLGRGRPTSPHHQQHNPAADDRSRYDPPPGKCLAKKLSSNDNCPEHAGFPKRRDNPDIDVVCRPQDDGVCH